MTPSSVKVQISPESVPSIPSWFGEVTLIAHVFTQRGWLSAIMERVQFARARFGTYDTIDFVVVLLGYAISGERTLKEFYERLTPFGKAFMSLFQRADLPSHSALSRYLCALDQSAVEALRTLFQESLGACHSLGQGGLYDREGTRWVVVDVDGTREAARQRALPHGPDLPAAHRRMDALTAPGYPGRKRGEVVRSRTTVLQAHTQSWLGTFGGAGNGDYRGELLCAIQAIKSLAQAWSIPLSRILIRLDGLYGNAAPLIDLLTAGPGMVVRGKDYALLELPSVQARLALPPDEWSRHPESGIHRALFDCPEIQLAPAGPTVRMIVAVHPAPTTPAPIGITKNGLVYEIFLTVVPAQAFTPGDLLHLYLHRGSFETVLAHEDQEQDPDRWVSHTPCGQECWQILSQWIWNTRLELGQHLQPIHLRLTELVPEAVGTFPNAPALLQAMAPHAQNGSVSPKAPGKALAPLGYGPPVLLARSARIGFAGTEFALQPDGTLRCPADKPLYSQERVLKADGSLRIVYAARISDCRVCPLRESCQGPGQSSRRARQVSATCQPRAQEGSALAHDADAHPPTDDCELGSTPPTSRDADSHREPPSMSAPKKRTLPPGYGPPTFSARSAHAGFAGTAFALQSDGTVLCPGKHPLSLREQRPLCNGSIRLVYAARISACRVCPLREPCQGPDNSLRRARKVHALSQPLPVQVPPMEIEPGEAGLNVQTPLEPASAPVEAVSGEFEPLPPPTSPIPTAPEPTSAAVQVTPGETESSPPSASSVQTPLEPISAPRQNASLETESSPPPTASDPPGASPHSSAVLWCDWPASHIRQQWQKRLRIETVHLTIGPPEMAEHEPSPLVLTRAQRAHWRLSWRERFARNARRASAPELSITLHGLPASFAQMFALALAA